MGKKKKAFEMNFGTLLLIIIGICCIIFAFKNFSTILGLSQHSTNMKCLMVRNAYYINKGGNTRNKKSADCNIHMRKLQSADVQQTY